MGKPPVVIREKLLGAHHHTQSLAERRRTKDVLILPNQK